MPLSDWIQPPSVSHSYEAVLPLDPERALAHALSTPVAPDRLVRTLFKLRGFDPDGSLEVFGSRAPFKVLSHTPTEWVAGVGFEPPGRVRAVMNLKTVSRPGADGWSRLTTETLARAEDPAAARMFKAYWLFVGPFSKLIRKRWLRAMSERARAVGTR